MNFWAVRAAAYWIVLSPVCSAQHSSCCARPCGWWCWVTWLTAATVYVRTSQQAGFHLRGVQGKLPPYGSTSPPAVLSLLSLAQTRTHHWSEKALENFRSACSIYLVSVCPVCCDCLLLGNIWWPIKETHSKSGRVKSQHYSPSLEPRLVGQKN